MDYGLLLVLYIDMERKCYKTVCMCTGWVGGSHIGNLEGWGMMSSECGMGKIRTAIWHGIVNEVN